MGNQRNTFVKENSAARILKKLVNVYGKYTLSVSNANRVLDL